MYRGSHGCHYQECAVISLDGLPEGLEHTKVQVFIWSGVKITKRMLHPHECLRDNHAEDFMVWKAKQVLPANANGKRQRISLVNQYNVMNKAPTYNEVKK